MDIQPLLPHSDTILYLVQYYKASVPVGLSVPLVVVGNQYSRVIFGQDQIVVTADHDWHADKMVTSVTNRMNITERAGESLYSGGINGLGRIFVLVNNATTDPSTGLKHIANAYEVLTCLSKKSRSAPDDQFVQTLPYRVHFETDVGTDHRATIFSNQIACIGIFFWETWILLCKLAVVLGFFT